MRISELKISNILSFALKESFDQTASDITFQKGVNIIVGANGSGKSNFVETLFTLFQSYFMEPYEFNGSFDTDPDNSPRYISKKASAGPHLRLGKNYLTPDSPSHVQIKIGLNDADKMNLTFLSAHLSELNELAGKYNLAPNLFEQASFPITLVNIETLGELVFKFEVQNSNPKIKPSFVLIRDTTVEQRIIDFYLTNFDLIRKLLEVGVEREGKTWQNLAISFEFLGSHRRFEDFPQSLNFDIAQNNSVGNHEFNKKSTNIKSSTDFSHVFNIPLAKIGNKIANYNYEGVGSIPTAITTQFTEGSAVMVKINTLLQSYLGFKVKYTTIPSRSSKTLNLEITNTNTNKKVDFTNLSSGQKSIFSLIFLVSGLDVDNGVLVIDEPEIHLHPKLQKKYFNLLKKFSDEIGLQVILITHSPVFIDEKTIKNTFRFYMVEGSTKVVQGNLISQPDEELIKFLNYTNSAKIFFTNKVILVEGETDNYFFTYFLDTLGLSENDYEILSIGGKDEHTKWFSFLEKLKIKSYFVTDFDFIATSFDAKIETIKNTIIEDGLTNATLQRVKDTLRKTKNAVIEDLARNIEVIKNKKLSEITEVEINVIKDTWYFLAKRRIPIDEIVAKLKENVGDATAIDSRIVELKAQNIYVLKHGDLEAYLALEAKGLQEVVNYCSGQKITKMDTKHLTDITEIFKDIISK